MPSAIGDAKLELRCCQSPPAGVDGCPFSDDTLRNWPSLVREDTSQRYLNVLPGCWITKKDLSCLLGIIGNLYLCRIMHRDGANTFAKPWLNEGKWVALELENPFRIRHVV